MAASNTTAHSPHVATDIPQTERYQKGAGFSSGSPKLPVSSISVSGFIMVSPVVHHTDVASQLFFAPWLSAFVPASVVPPVMYD